MKKRNRILVALLAAISVLTAGCSGEIEQNPIGLEQEESQAEESVSATESTTENEKAPDMLASQKKLYNQNKDTIGWIEVPGTSVDNVIVQKKDEAENDLLSGQRFQPSKIPCRNRLYGLSGCIRL